MATTYHGPASASASGVVCAPVKQLTDLLDVPSSLGSDLPELIRSPQQEETG